MKKDYFKNVGAVGDYHRCTLCKKTEFTNQMTQCVINGKWETVCNKCYKENR